MFVIEDLSEEQGEEEYNIDTRSAIENVRSYVAGFGNDFTTEQLGFFGMNSMEEFSTFTPEIQNHLRTGMWNYLWIEPSKSNLPADFDTSYVGICFGKALEFFLKQSFFQALKAVLNYSGIRDITMSGLDCSKATIGDFSTIIERQKNTLAAFMAKQGQKEYDSDWWKGLSEKIRKCKQYRNTCAHTGSIFPWADLEHMLSLLFTDSKTVKNSIFSKEHVIHGLLFERDFSKIVDASGIMQNSQAAPAPTKPIQPAPGIIKTFCLVKTRIRKCQIDQAPLEQKIFDVMKKSGEAKKMNMQFCTQCGRRYLNVLSLSNTQNLNDYLLTAVLAEDWTEDK